MGPGWRQRPRTFAPQASVRAAGVRDDVGHEYTCFMRGGEDARLHERFSGTEAQMHSDSLPRSGFAVAYLLAADNFIGPLLSRRRGTQQPVVRPRQAFSAP